MADHIKIADNRRAWRRRLFAAQQGLCIWCGKLMSLEARKTVAPRAGQPGRMRGVLTVPGEDTTIERELWDGDQANTRLEERAARELYRRRLRIAELEARLHETEERLKITAAPLRR